MSLLDLQIADPLSSAVTLLEKVERWWSSGQWLFAQEGSAIHVWDLSRPVEAMPFTVLSEATFELPQSSQAPRTRRAGQRFQLFKLEKLRRSTDPANAEK